DLFRAIPPGTVLIHACNAQGSWGGGIAKSFRQRYPGAFQVYKDHCSADLPEHHVGKSLYIPPQPGDPPGHTVCCLFTSKLGGSQHDRENEILTQTENAMRHLLRELSWQERTAQAKFSGGLRMPRINSGIFGVKWENTHRQLHNMVLAETPAPEGIGEGDTYVVVYSQPRSPADGKKNKRKAEDDDGDDGFSGMVKKFKAALPL
ncbi:ADP-ribose 1''-phosphate phosphatase, partial [Cladorrhinum sp. PSN332]